MLFPIAKSKWPTIVLDFLTQGVKASRLFLLNDRKGLQINFLTQKRYTETDSWREQKNLQSPFVHTFKTKTDLMWFLSGSWNFYPNRKLWLSCIRDHMWWIMKTTLNIFYLLGNKSTLRWRILDIAGFSDPTAVASTYWREFPSALRPCIFFTLLKGKGWDT